MTDKIDTSREKLPVFTKEFLIEQADKIDSRLGPISGREADALARLLRATAAYIGLLQSDRADGAIARAEKAEAEVVRLREALERIESEAHLGHPLATKQIALDTIILICKRAKEP